jgi:HK97 family phage major capsid protein
MDDYGALPRELRDQLDDFRRMLNGIRAKQTEFDAELRKRGGADPLVKASMQRMEDDLNALHKKLARPSFGVVTTGSEAERKAEAEFRAWKGGAGVGTTRADYSRAFDKFLRREPTALTPDEQKALAVGSSPDGGFYVEPFRASTLVTKLYETSDLRRVARVISISSNTYEEPVDRQLTTSGWVGEQSSRPETNTAQIGMLQIPVHEHYALVRATQNILDDSGINMEEWLNGKIADDLGLQENTAFVTGNGSSKPQGI